MQPASMHSTGQQRAPGSFSSLQPSTSTTPQLRPIDASDSEASLPGQQGIPLVKRKASQNAPVQAQPRPAYNSSLTFHSTSSTPSLTNFSRPSATFSRTGDLPLRNASPLAATTGRSSLDIPRGHSRKHSNSAGFFEPTLPTTSTLSMANHGGLSASQIAAQAAVQNQHQRQRSQTVPSQQGDGGSVGSRRPSKGPTSPPLLSLTEASGPSQNGFGGGGYHNGLLGSNTSAATTAAAAAFPRSPSLSPGLPPAEFSQVVPEKHDKHEKPEKPVKAEKKSKLFGRPGKISIKDKDGKEKGLPSPNKLGSYANPLHRAAVNPPNSSDPNSSSSSMYSVANSSNATIRAPDTPVEKEKEKEKEKHKHHFLSRQKHKLSSKDEHHLPLSSAASNSKPVDPSAPSSLYNFSLPPSPGPGSTSFTKSMSGLDLRHGGRALREKKKEEKAAAGTESSLREVELSYQTSNDWPGPSSLGSAGNSYLSASAGAFSHVSSLYGLDVQAPDSAKYGLHNMTADDAWPFLKAKLLIIFEGEDLRLPVEDFNKLVTTHIQRCIQKRSPSILIEDLRDLLNTGFSSLDQTLRPVPSERFISHLVEIWLFTFTSILPYMQAVFLPLDLEFSGSGPLLSPSAARDLFSPLSSSTPLDVRKIVLIAFRDTVILPRFEMLKGLFSRLSLESIGGLNASASEALSTSPDSVAGGRPGTAMSLDPSLGSYNSQTTTLLNGVASGTDSGGARSRAISNVSYTSDPASRSDAATANIASMPPPLRPFTPSSAHPSLLGQAREQWQREANHEDSKHVTEMVARMLQCVSVLASVGGGSSMSATGTRLARSTSLGGASTLSAGSAAGLGITYSAGATGKEEVEDQRKMEDLCKTLKLNWLGRGRTGRNRRGFVGARVRRDGDGTFSML